MATITAAQVNELRQRTGLGMMECKKALQENDGNVDQAVEYFRKKGVKTSLLEREAGEGRVAVKVNAERARGVIVEIKCNTDFTANSDPVKEIGDIAADALLADPDANVHELESVKDKLVSVAQKTGENVQIGKTIVMNADAGETIGHFLYTVTHKIAVLVKVKGAPSEEVLRDVGLHVTASQPAPAAATRDQVPADQVAAEKAIAVEQAKATGKPQEIAEKIADGKLNAFYKQVVLAEQDFINPDKFKGTVSELLKQNGAELKEFVKFTVGS